MTSYLDLDYAIVAFVDILGFSEMVKSDCENKNGNLKFFEVLRKLNAKTKSIMGCSIKQFSDSIIFTLPLSRNNYEKMIRILSDYQYELICQSIVCRGAISYGKHYEENEFMFSQALIEAYQLECTEAKYPRIVISNNLMDLYNEKSYTIEAIIRERDTLFFVDYFCGRDKEKLRIILKKFSDEMINCSMNIKEKYYWLNEYWEYTFQEGLDFNKTRFERIK